MPPEKQNSEEDIKAIKRNLTLVNDKVEQLTKQLEGFTLAAIGRKIFSAIRYLFTLLYKLLIDMPRKLVTGPERHYSVAMLIVYALGVVFGGDLLADSIRTGLQESVTNWTVGLKLDAYLSEIFWQSQDFFTSPYILSAGLGLIIFMFCAWRLYKMRSGYLVTKYVILKGNDNAKRKVLVMGLSNFNKAAKPEKDKIISPNDIYNMALQGRLEEVVEKGYFGKEAFFSWQQNLRSMLAHKGQMEKLYLIGSQGENGSARYFEDFKLMCEKIYGNDVETHKCPEIILLGEADYQDMGSVSKILQEGIDNQILKNYGESDICIDFTAGTAVLSAAFVMVTINRKLIFSYVNNDGEVTFGQSNISMPDAAPGG